MNTTKEEVQSLLKKLPDFWNETQRIIGYHEQLVLGFTFIQPNPHNLGHTNVNTAGMILCDIQSSYQLKIFAITASCTSIGVATAKIL